MKQVSCEIKVLQKLHVDSGSWSFVGCAISWDLRDGIYNSGKWS